MGSFSEVRTSIRAWACGERRAGVELGLDEVVCQKGEAMRRIPIYREGLTARALRYVPPLLSRPFRSRDNIRCQHRTVPLVVHSLVPRRLEATSATARDQRSGCRLGDGSPNLEGASLNCWPVWESRNARSNEKPPCIMICMPIWEWYGPFRVRVWAKLLLRTL